ncbi:hypothetical protein HH214_21475 (plasmid) [Mucilaginibacter robiniae]|uniref:DUF6876 domain-containing protein n=1 Tax=Mucilaginibacter robiniae TaxID=2728022 RepID=A0A7L5E5D6_9SPHI|nr:DUF6876 family protein [Mucilaginibacter robiniae]QJD98530.1 hypothetical protein HH214_21475 [Mucilaginibacter robiniae]
MEDFRLNNTHEFNQFLGGSETTYKYVFGVTHTEGIKYLADNYQCYWLLDLICIHSRDIKNLQEFQVWNLKRIQGCKFELTATDGNKNILKKIEIKYSDFKADNLDVWLVHETILLPCEY